MTFSSLSTLQTTWRTLYTQTLPQLARAKNPAQPKWSVTLDHCFARIILDNSLGRSAGRNGEDTRWDTVIAKPAAKNMTETQLREAIELGEKIGMGEVDLVELDERSMRVRGKAGKAEKGKKRRAEDVPPAQVKSPKKRKQDDGKTQSTLSFSQMNRDEAVEEPKQLPSPAPEISHNQNKSSTHIDFPNEPSSEFFRTTLRRIADSDITPYRKRLYTILLSVPRGQYTTYAAMADFLNSSARAVGNGMRNNPFAPDVPCHRVLASDGTIGGFMGVWTKKGEKVDEKIERKIGMLKEEGVRFDSGGKVKGRVWKAFKDLEGFEKELGKIV